jgi:exonuclease SbcC
MKIEKLFLKNFLSHEENEITFDDGITMIIGHNGAGKSSIVDAIRFALFGEKRGTRKEDHIEDMIRKGKHEASVSMIFRSGMDRFQVTRLISQKKSDNYATLDKNDLKIADTVTGVNQEIEDIIGISKDVFMNSIFVRQGEMDSLISEDASRRKDIFSRLLGLDRISRTSDVLKDIIRRLESERTGYEAAESLLDSERKLRVSLNSDIDQSRLELDSARKQREKLESDLSTELKNLENARSRLTEYEILVSKKRGVEDSMKRDNLEISRLRKKETEINPLIKNLEEIDQDPVYRKRDLIRQYFQSRSRQESLQQNYETISGQIKILKDTLEKISLISDRYAEFKEKENLRSTLLEALKKVEINHTRYIEVSSEVKTLTLKIDKNSRILADLENSVKRKIPDTTIPENFEELSAVRNRIALEIESFGIERQKVISKIASTSERLEDLEKKHSMIGGQNICPVCGSDLDEEHSRKLDEEYSREMERSRNEKHELENRLRALDLRIKSLTDERKNASNSEIERIITFRDEIKRDRENLDSLQMELEAYGKLEQEYMKLKEDISRTEEIIKEMIPVRDEYISLVSRKQTLESAKPGEKLEALTPLLQSATTETETLAGEIGFVPDITTLARIDEMEKKVQQAKQARDEYISLKSGIAAIETRMKDSTDEINRLMDSIKSMSDPKSLVSEKEITVENLRILKEKSIAFESGLDSKIDTLEKQIAEAEKRIEEMAVRARYFKMAGSALITLRKIREAFDRDGIQASIRHDSAAIITDRTRSYLSSFGLNIEDARVDEDFNIMISQNGMEQSISSLSGGEKTAVAIAVRLAIAGYLTQRISTMVLDEPTAFLDEDRRRNLKDIIQYSLRNENLVPQMIIISHHSDMNTVADVTYEVRMISGKSVIESV